MSEPCVTVVTPSFNSGSTIAKTIESVLNQTYPHIDYIVMDGGSRDNTAEIVAPYQADPRLTFISEPDEGQSDAINKGWQRAKGEFVAWLCADDRYLPHTIQTAVDYFTANPDAGWVYGRDAYINIHGDPIPFVHHVTEWSYDRVLSQDLYISQPTVFWRKQIVDEFGYLRQDLDWGMDMEYYLRIGRKYPGHKLDEQMAIITWSRETKTFGEDKKRRLREIESISQQYGGGDLAQTLHVEWAEAYLMDGFKALRHGKFGDAMTEFRASLAYGSHLPKALGKVAVRSLLSEQMETRLRQALIHR